MNIKYSKSSNESFGPSPVMFCKFAKVPYFLVLSKIWTKLVKRLELPYIDTMILASTLKLIDIKLRKL